MKHLFVYKVNNCKSPVRFTCQSFHISAYGLALLLSTPALTAYTISQAPPKHASEKGSHGNYVRYYSSTVWKYCKNLKKKNPVKGFGITNPTELFEPVS